MTWIQGRKIRVALVGCGRISANHFQAFKQFPQDIELVAVCDTNSERLRIAEKEQNVLGYSNLQSLLDQPDFDLGILCTPSGLHAEQAIALACSGRHVISEKPMATRFEDGLKMVEVCQQKDVKLFVVKQNRHNSTLQLLKSTIQSGRFGKIYMVQINVFWSRPQEYYDMAPWRGTWALDGGALMNQASHYVDLLTWLFGPIQDVHCFTGTLARKIEAEDTAVANIKWTSGILGSMAVTMLTYPQNLEGSITILGEKGTAKLGGLAVNEIQEWTFSDERPEDRQLSEVSYNTTSVYGFGHPIYYKNVVDCLRGKGDPVTDGREGLKSLEVLCALYSSARENKIISLPLES